MPALPPVTDLTNAASAGALKAGLAAAWAYLGGLLGTAGTQATALAALGTAFSSVEARTVASSIAAADRGKFIQATGTWTLSLGAAATLGAGFIFILRNAGAGVITLDGNASETVAGGLTATVAAGSSVIVVCTGAAWEVLPMSGSGGGGGGFPAKSINSQTGTSYTMQNSDFAGNVLVRCNNASPFSLILNTGLTGVEPAHILQYGAGQITLSGTATIRKATGQKSRAQYSLFSILPIGTDEYAVVGDVVA